MSLLACAEVLCLEQGGQADDRARTLSVYSLHCSSLKSWLDREEALRIPTAKIGKLLRQSENWDLIIKRLAGGSVGPWSRLCKEPRIL